MSPEKCLRVYDSKHTFVNNAVPERHLGAKFMITRQQQEKELSLWGRWFFLLNFKPLIRSYRRFVISQINWVQLIANAEYWNARNAAQNKFNAYATIMDETRSRLFCNLRSYIGRLLLGKHAFDCLFNVPYHQQCISLPSTMKRLHNLLPSSNILLTKIETAERNLARYVKSPIKTRVSEHSRWLNNGGDFPRARRYFVCYQWLWRDCVTCVQTDRVVITFCASAWHEMPSVNQSFTVRLLSWISRT